MERSQVFAQGVRSDEVAERAAALAALEAPLLEDPDLVQAVFERLRDEEPTPAAWQPERPADPFASFFGEVQEAPPYTVADLATDRLVALGLPGTPDTVEAIAAAFEAGPPTAKLCSAAARMISATAWSDEVGAVQRLVPLLLAADASLFEALPGLSRPALRAIIDCALHPFSARALNELLNHPHASDPCAEAISAAIVQGRWVPTEAEAVEVLPLLAVWGHKDPVIAAGAAAALEAKHPWAAAFGAFDNADAARRFEAWMGSGAALPPKLALVLNGALRDRPERPFFPLEAWLRWTDGEVHLIEEWKRGEACQELLIHWVRAWHADGQRGERAWDAIVLLMHVGAHEPVLDIIAAHVTEIPFEREFLRRLGAARPPVPGAWEHLCALAVAEPARIADVQPGLIAAERDLRPVIDALLQPIEAAPWVEETSKRGLRTQVKAGHDVRALRSLVDHVGDAELQHRFDELLPRKI